MPMMKNGMYFIVRSSKKTVGAIWYKVIATGKMMTIQIQSVLTIFLSGNEIANTHIRTYTNHLSPPSTSTL